MKKLIAMLLTVLTLCTGATGLTACGKENLIVIGVTDYEPMDYLDENGDWVGFDAELARKVFEDLGYKVKFREINWETKIVTLQSGEIDVIWNGMTVTEELQQNLTLSDTYLENRQYGLVKTQDRSLYTSVNGLTGKKVAVEMGSAAKSLIEDVDCTKNVLETQSAAVMEVAAGTSDIAIVDYTMAKTLTAEGSDYYGTLTAVDLGFDPEEYAIGFRKKDTELCNNVNAQLKKLKESGFIRELAQKYDIENLLIG